MNKCDFCICKTCAIAYYNGGAPGCGDCWLCEGTPNQHGVTICNEYYNPTPRERKPSPYDAKINDGEESQEKS